MTEQEARQILLLYRPGSPEAGDADVVEALAMLRQSPELQKWFEQHCVGQKAIATGFRKIPVPEGLREQILSERKAHTSGFLPKNPASLVASLAVLAAIVAIAVFVLGPEWNKFDPASFTTYRGRMVYTALEAYRMDLETNNLSAVRSYLAGQQALADWTLPKGLERADPTGCGVVHWQGRLVSMICFHSGNPLRPGQKTDVWLFVIDRNIPHRPPGSSDPQLAKIENLTTASWSADGKTYLLAVQGDENLLRRFL